MDTRSYYVLALKNLTEIAANGTKDMAGVDMCKETLLEVINDWEDKIKLNKVIMENYFKLRKDFITLERAYDTLYDEKYNKEKPR